MIETIKNKWNEILSFMRNEFDVSDISYDNWLMPLVPYKVENGKFYVIVTADDEKIGRMLVNIITKKYKDFLSIAILKVLKFNLEVVFITQDEKDDISSPNESVKNETREYDFNSVLRSKGLNPKYTFNSFVKGKSNAIAHAASVAVAEQPGIAFKILYIHGGVGLGKTHLMHAIAIYVLKNDPNANIIYTTSEGFTNEYIDAIKKNTTEEFRNKYRNADVLLIDDIQFIANKESTQEEFFNTFNALFNANKQIVITSDKPPKDINNLEERIKSRFEGGMVADIQEPDFETRMAILRKKEELEGYNIDDEVLKFMATNIKSNIRKLEGALQKLVFNSKLNNSPINIDNAKITLKDFIYNDESSGKVTPEKIISVVAEHYQINERDIISAKKNKELAYPRQIIMYLCCEITDATQKVIGAALGGRDHATIIHGRDKITEDLKNNEKLRNDIDILKKKISP